MKVKQQYGDFFVEKLTMTTLYIKIIWILSVILKRKVIVLNAFITKQERIKISEAFNPRSKKRTI